MQQVVEPLTLLVGEFATAIPNTYLLSVNRMGVGGNGTVTSNPGGINCGNVCQAEFTEGTSVTLTAQPASGSSFAGWSGACSGTGSCTVTMDQARSVTARFAGVNDEPTTYTYATTFMGSLAQSSAGASVELNPNLAPIFTRILERQLTEQGNSVIESGAFMQLVQVFTFVASPPDQRHPSPLGYLQSDLEAARNAAKDASGSD